MIVGGANGIGLSIAMQMVKRETCEKVYIVDKELLSDEYKHSKIECFRFDLTDNDYSFFDRFSNVDALMITAGFGRLALFKDIDEQYIINSMNVLFDLLSTAKNKDLTMEASNQIMIAVYKSFRSIYGLNKTNPDSLFAAEKDCYRELANAALIKSDVRLKALTKESKSVKVKPVRVNEEDFALNQSQIEEKYPSFAASLFNLIQNAEIAMQVKTKK